jgi:Integrase zinc binding domain/RNase H-like domain found in reverse transcriptase
MKALAHWRQYLGWTKEPFTIMMDHVNLQYWKSPKNLNRQTAWWHADLQEYDYEILYIPGKTNVPPDVLSQLPEADQGKEDNKDVVIIPEDKFKVATAGVEGKIKVPNLNEIKQGIMRLVHDLLTAGHPGQDETLWKTQEHYYWPHMKEWIADYVKGCTTCQQNKVLTHQKKTPIYCIPTELNA